MRLSETQSDGSTLRDHLLAAARAGHAVELLERRAPAGTSPLWDAFASLASARQNGAAIPASEIDAWQRIHGVRLTPWEVDTLVAMDRACINHLRARDAQRQRAAR